MAAQTHTIPQPKPLPVIDNLRDIDVDAPVQSLMRLARVYGPIFRPSLGGEIATFLSYHDLVNEVCDETRFRKKLLGNDSRVYR